MKKWNDVYRMVKNGDLDASLLKTGCENLKAARERATHVMEGFKESFGATEDTMVALCSAPGRTEICGNHTDHQHGRVLAAAENLDFLACVALNGTCVVHFQSEGWPMTSVDLADLEVKEEEKEILQEEKARKRKSKKAEKRKVRTGGFVDEIDEEDVTERPAGRKASAMARTAQTAASEAHEELKKEIAAATSEDLEEAPAAERIQRRQPEPKAARPQPRRAVEAGEEEEEPVTIGSLAMPSLSAAQLANRVKKAGDAPDIVKDDITNVTLFDYSDIISGEADDMEE